MALSYRLSSEFHFPSYISIITWKQDQSDLYLLALYSKNRTHGTTRRNHTLPAGWISKANISEHLKNIYKSEELIQSSTVRNFRTVRQEGNRQITRNLEYYNLDVIISVGYRVNTKRGIQFRQWANSQAHDRFLIIDQSDVYHIGASLKDLGKKLFAFSKMDIPASILTKLL